MGLWLEHRNDQGLLIFRGRFVDGVVTVPPDEGQVATMTLDLKQAQQLAKLSSREERIERRDWALRIGFEE